MSSLETAAALRSVPFWKRQRYRLEYFGLRAASALVCLLPWRWGLCSSGHLPACLPACLS
jgi:hypothetical protein